MMRQVFRLPLTHTEGLLTSLVRLLDVDIAVPDYSCLTKRSIDLRLDGLAPTVTAGSQILADSTGLKVYGKEKWNQEKYLILTDSVDSGFNPAHDTMPIQNPATFLHPNRKK